jgi:NADH-quinone oxidoreductase subunit C
MTFEEILTLLQEKFGAAIESFDEPDPKRPLLLRSIVVQPDSLVEVCRFLHDDPKLKFEYLNCITDTDMKDTIQLAYLMTSYMLHQQISIKVNLDRETPSITTVESIWATANWNEREIFDLLGVNFNDHSDLRRILMPDDWNGYPLRKDYKEQPDYHGMPTTRINPLGKY